MSNQYSTLKKCNESCIYEKFTFPKVELHVHLDGAARLETLYELAHAKCVRIPGNRSLEALREKIVSSRPADLAKVLSAFDYFLPIFSGDLKAIERIAYELCETEARNGVVYFEARYSPHLLCITKKNKKDPLTPKEVIEAVYRGFDDGERDFNVKARSILCCISGHEDWCNDVLKLAIECKEWGVVGIDVAGCSSGADEKYGPDVVKVFQEAALRQIHRTVHAGESGTAASVIHAIEDMHAERIGHGYRLTLDPENYEKYAVKGQIHFEACPYSSVMTGAVPETWETHPVVQWARDKVNFSISTDDPTCFGNSYTSELLLSRYVIGLSQYQLWQCQLNAATSAFLEGTEKTELIDRIVAAKPKKID